MSVHQLDQVCCQIVPLIQRLTSCVALSSTDLWMERMINKKQDDVELAAVRVDPFEELQQYLQQLQLKRGDCPNSITWWGVSTVVTCLLQRQPDHIS
jgi:hypothetical protein